MVQRWNVCAIVFWRVVWYRAGTFLCMRSCPCPSWPWRGRRALDVVTSLGVAVAVVSAVFVSPSCGCDTPMNASVCNGFGVVYVGSICTTYVGRV